MKIKKHKDKNVKKISLHKRAVRYSFAVTGIFLIGALFFFLHKYENTNKVDYNVKNSVKETLSFKTEKTVPRKKIRNANVYYVDCTNGSDSNSGMSSTSAWKSLRKANNIPLTAGSSLLLKKGCTWQEPLIISSNGTSSNNIFIGSYGDGDIPVIQSTSFNAVTIKGSYITIQDLYARIDAANFEAGCQNNPKGSTVGFSFDSGSANNTLQNSIVTGAYAGVFINSNSHNNKIINNKIIDNTMMQGLDTAPDNDYGAFGILLWGDDNEISHNTIRGSNACSYDYVTDGSDVEIYGGQRNLIAYNKGYDSDAFTELGNPRSADNTYAYNLFTSSLPRSSFLVTRGGGTFGPVYNTKAINNTVYLTGSISNAVQCLTCSPSVLFLENNIFWSAKNNIQGSVGESNNIYWEADNNFQISPSSKMVDPQFISPGTDFHLQATSPAINSGKQTTFTKDLDGTPVPNGDGVDIGALEF